MTTTSARDIALKWIELYNDGAPDYYGSDRFLELYAEAVDWHEMPTRAHPEGRTGNLDSIRAVLQIAQSTLRNRQVSLHELLADGDRSAMRFTWEATVAADGWPAPRGSRMRLELAQFNEVADGRIVRSIEYVILAPTS